MRWAAIGAAVLVASLALGACGGGTDGSDPVGEIRNCLEKAGATIAADSTPLSFAFAPDSSSKVDHAGLDKSGTLSVGSVHGSGAADWEIFYVTRKGFHLSAQVLARDPEKAAKVVAFVKPANRTTVEAANDCL
jgi:hypothetical protein